MRGFKDNRDNRDNFLKLQNFWLLKEWAAEHAPDKLKHAAKQANDRTAEQANEQTAEQAKKTAKQAAEQAKNYRKCR